MSCYLHLREKMSCYFPLCTMLCVLCILESVVYTSGCIAEEKAALMQIGSSLMEANSQLPDSWGRSDDCCSWYRVKCNKNARVSELKLAGTSIYEVSGCWGNLNLSIFSPFHELQLLDLSSNSACLQNLDGLQGLTELRYLNLSYNIFITNDAMGSLGKLAALEFIHLERTGLSGPLQNIAFKNLKKLRGLYLASNQLNGRIPASLFELPHLKYLDLSGNLLQGHIPLRNCTMLEVIALSGNTELSIDVKFHGLLPSFQLRSLKLSRCNLDTIITEGQNFIGMPRVSELELAGIYEKDECQGILNLSIFSPFHELQVLDLSSNSACLQNLDGLQGLIKLRYLDLSYNSFIMNDAMGSLGKLTSLEFLHLESSNMRGPLQNIDFRNLKKLRSLYLASNQLNGSIPASLFELAHLQYLDLSGNLLQGYVPINSSSSVPLSLRALWLSGNNLNGTFDFFWLRNCTMLEVIDLSGNTDLSIDVKFRGLVPPFQLRSLKLSRCNLDTRVSEGPNFIVTQWRLQMIDLSNSKLKGSIPNWLFRNGVSLVYLDLANNLLVGSLDPMWQQQSNLQFINISMNHFEGQLPTNLSLVFPHLTILDASNNNMSGDLPPALCNVTGMAVVDLSNNKFTGEVPACLFSFIWKILKLSNNNLTGSIFSGSSYLSVEAIFLGNNNFQGELPSNLSGNVEIMDLHGNKLFGKLNSSFWNLPSLLALSVAGNRLTGEMYPSICKLTSLEFLDISDNNFSGSIPNCNSKLKLHFLNTSGNSLSGFPTNFFNGYYVTALDLRYNQFIGTLDWIQYLSRVRLLLLGGNRFEGHITPNLCHLQYLNVIDLSHNRLSGSLPHCIGGISFGYHEDDLPSSISGINALIIGFPPTTVLYSVDVQFYLQGFTFSTKGKLYTYGHSFFNLMFGIDLSANMLSGEIPWEVGNLSHVKSLNLSHNFFTGRIPPALANMSAIESLDLSHNELSGPIPWELTRLWSLEVFSVAYNYLSGCIPYSGQFASFTMDSYQGNKNIKNMSLGNGCSAASGPVAPPLEDVGAPSDPILYMVSTSSFVLAFWVTVAFSFCHSYGRSVILNI